jgi:type IV pilus assembly protein PilB
MKYVEKMKRKKLGELLIDEGLVTSDQVVEALQEQKKTGEPIGQLLVSFGFISEWDIARTMANQFQLPFIHTARYSVSKEVLDLFPNEFLHRHQCVPLDRFESIITVAVASPIAQEVVEELQAKSQCDVYLYVALPSDVRHTLAQQFPVEGSAAAAPEGDAPIDRPVKRQADTEVTETDEDAMAAALEGASEGEWMKLFDLANESVLSEIKVEPDENDD